MYTKKLAGFLIFMFMTFTCMASAATMAWQRLDNMSDAQITQIAASPTNPNMIYAGGEGVFKSTDNCKTWTIAKKGLRNTEILALVFDEDGNLYSTTDSGVFELKQASDTWARAAALPKNANITVPPNKGFPNSSTMVVALGQDANGNIYAATDQGLFKLTQGSNTWAQMNFSQKSNQFLFLLDQATKILYLFNKNAGIYALAPNSTTWQLIDNNAGFAPFSQQYGSGTALSIEAMAVGGNGKFCVQTNWGMYVQK